MLVEDEIPFSPAMPCKLDETLVLPVWLNDLFAEFRVYPQRTVIGSKGQRQAAQKG